MPSKRELGFEFEALAAKYLREQGCRPVAKNFYSRAGEIDLIVTHDKTIVFVEVKYRTQSTFGHPSETVTYSKQKKVIKTAQLFLQRNPKYAQLDARFDVVSIVGDKSNNSPDITWLKGAFTT